MQTLFHAHSGFRYLVLLVGAVAVVYYAVSAARGGAGGRGSRVLMSVFTGVLDLQVLLGVALALSGIFYPALLGHILMMVFAAAVAHLAGVAARRAEPARADRIRLTGVVVALALIVFGILSIGRAVFGTGVPSVGG